MVAPEGEPWRALASLAALALFCRLLASLEDARPAWSLLAGLAFGASANAVVLASVIDLLARFSGLPRAVCVLLALLLWLAQGAPYALAAYASARLVPLGVPRTLALPAALTVALAWVPQLFPWHVAATLLGALPLVQVADLGGEALVGLVLTIAACTLARAHAAPRRAALVIALSCLAPAAYGLVRMAQIERLRADAPTLRIGVVQSNVSVTEKHDARRAHDVLARLRQETAALERAGAEVTLWGETAYPYPLPRDARRAPEDVRAVLADGVRGPVLLGLETYEGFDDDARKYNSAWLVRADGTLGDRADKARLLAFGEYVPLWRWLPPLHARFRSGGFSAGAPGVVRVETPAGTARLGVLVCYEDLFASLARASLRRGASALVNLTNDAWFGVSRVPALHDLVARMRAIELRRDLVRAVNTGVSSFTTAGGDTVVRTRPFERARFVAPVRLLSLHTPFARFGDWVPPTCLGGLGLTLLRRRMRARPRAR